MNQQEFSFFCGYGSEHWPLMYWGGGVRAGIKWLALIQEDHAFTFKTVEQRFNPGCLLPYGPSRKGVRP